MKRKEFEKTCRQCYYFGPKGKRHPEPQCLHHEYRDHHSGGRVGIYNIFSRINEKIYNGEKIERCPNFVNGIEEHILNKKW